MRGWVQRAMRALSNYPGTFPVPELCLAVRVVTGRGVGNGVTHAAGLSSINIRLGHHVSQRELD